MSSFNINTEHFSLLGSSFFISYALMQLPVGIIVYKYGVKRPLVISVFLCAFAVLGFSFSNNLISAVLFRFLMGVGSSFGFIALLSLAINWFSSKNFGFFSGLSQLLGSIGPLLAGAPLASIVTKSDNHWRIVFISLAVFGIFLAIIYAFLLQNKPRAKNKIIFLEQPKKILESFAFLKKIQVIYIIIYTALIYVSMPIIGSYWGTLYLQTRKFSKPMAAFLSSLIWIGYCLAAPIIGKLSDKVRKRNPFIIASAAIGFIGSACLLYIPTNNTYFLATIFILIGISGAGQALSFVVITENVPKHSRTTMLGINNMILMLTGAIIPSIIGVLLQSDLPSKGVYTQVGFEKGLTVMPIIFIICFFLALFGIKETFCRSKYEVLHLKPDK